MSLAGAQIIERPVKPSDDLNFKRFRLTDQKMVDGYVEEFSPRSCEYNFANLFSWQDVYDMSWTLYQGRLLIYDGLSDTAFMPLGHDFSPEDLLVLSLNLQKKGLSPNFGLATRKYLAKYPGLQDYYQIVEQRDAAEYIYDVNRLVELSGTKLHKKKNLIAQFKKYYPNYQVHKMVGSDSDSALAFTRDLLKRRKIPSKTLEQEFEAIKTAFENFDTLRLEGVSISIKDQLIAYAVFSRISDSFYDIQFEKADPDFKGAGQLINHESAKYLQGKCRFVNREQDLGIKGLRQAKLSYDPVDLMTSFELLFNPPN